MSLHILSHQQVSIYYPPLLIFGEYKDVNVLEDPNIRIKLSEYSNWPTIPQLFVNGELIGGCDITVELFQNGELKKILGLND